MGGEKNSQSQLAQRWFSPTVGLTRIDVFFFTEGRAPSDYGIPQRFTHFHGMLNVYPISFGF